jgi:hypothetical protein
LTSWRRERTSGERDIGLVQKLGMSEHTERSRSQACLRTKLNNISVLWILMSLSDECGIPAIDPFADAPSALPRLRLACWRPMQNGFWPRCFSALSIQETVLCDRLIVEVDDRWYVGPRPAILHVNVNSRFISKNSSHHRKVLGRQTWPSHWLPAPVAASDWQPP